MGLLHSDMIVFEAGEGEQGYACILNTCCTAIIVLIILGATGHFKKEKSNEDGVTPPPTIGFNPLLPGETLASDRNLTEIMETDAEFKLFGELDETEVVGPHDQHLRGLERMAGLQLEGETDGN